MIDAGPGQPDGSNPDDTTIFEIQDGTIAVGAPVTIRGVVVTAIDRFGGTQGGVYVSEPAGGAYSGVFVYNADTTDVDALEVGDLVDVEGGIVDEFALKSDTSGRALTEIVPPMGGTISITRVGTGQVPAATLVDPVLAASDVMEAEKWEGVLIRFENVSVLGNIDPINEADLFFQYQISGPYLMDSSLTSLGDLTTPAYVRGDCLASITGLGTYFFNDKILPRDAADLVTGTGCPAEDDMTECTNGTDDDGDGFVDCADFSCQQAFPAMCTADVTIYDVQMGVVSEGSLVTLTDVVVTGVFDDMGMNNRDLVWVQEPTGGVRSGVVVFQPQGTPIGDLQVGDIVTVEGTVDEFFDVTEIAGMPIITETGTGPAPAPLDVFDTTDLADPVTGEDYEGVLVRVSTVEVTATPDNFGEWGAATVGGTEVRVDNRLYSPYTFDAGTMMWTGPAVGTPFASLAGPMHYDFGDFRIVPRSSADVLEP
jgi:hypothetical protein